MKEEARLIIVRSSAGSGKTYTLVLHYLRIALMKPEAFDEILAITFTNKATGEMKERIIKALKSLSDGNEKFLAETLSELTGLSPEEIKWRSDKLLKLILHRYTRLAVMTIDSFFYRLIRPVARELGISLNREVELDTGRVVADIKQSLIMDAGKDDETTRWLEQFIIARMEENSSWNIDRDLTRQIEEIINDRNENFVEGSKAIDKELVDELKKIRNRFSQNLSNYSQKFFSLLSQHNLSTDDLKGKSRGVAGWFMKLDRGNYDFEKEKLSVEKYLESPEEWAIKNHQHKDEIVRLAERELIPLLKEVIDFLKSEWESYATATAVLQKIYVAALAEKIRAKLIRYRDEHEILLLPDINRIIAGALSINETNFVFEKTGNRFRHFLIDEFQDTALLQWKNLLPLVENGLSSGGQTLIVGDAKQSIYRWRGGKMELLLHGVKNDLGRYYDFMHEKNLSVNYRSAPEIIEFNNRFFSLINEENIVRVQEKVFSQAYMEGQITQQSNKSTKGFVEIKLLNNLKDDKQKKTQKRETLMNLMLDRIRQALNDGYTERDIAILTRTTEEASLIASFLIENNITRVLSPESLHAAASDKVQLLIHAMKLLLNNHELHRAACLYFYQRVTGRQPCHENSFGMAAEQQDFFNAMPAEFLNEMRLLLNLPLVDLAEHLIRIFSLRSDVFVIRFQDAILEFNEKEGGNLYAFMNWWEEHQEEISITLPESANAIRIMTIHKAKGLQFPVVFIPFADWQLRPKNDSVIWAACDNPPYAGYGKFPLKVIKLLGESYFKEEYQKEIDLTLIDNINLLYVAFTRAESRLHVFGFIPDKNSTVAGLIKSVLNHSPFAEMAQTNDSEIYFETGQMLQNGQRRTEAGLSAMNEFISQPWRNRITLALNKNLISVNDEPGAMQGLKFHQIMSEIILESDVEPTLKKYHAEQDTELKTVINKLLMQCRELNWFSGRYSVKTECPLLLPDGSVLRPDRLMLDENKIILLDYKTGNESEKHFDQVRNYAKVLQEAGYETQGCFIYYTQTGVLKKAC